MHFFGLTDAIILPHDTGLFEGRFFDPKFRTNKNPFNIDHQ